MVNKTFNLQKRLYMCTYVNTLYYIISGNLFRWAQKQIHHPASPNHANAAHISFPLRPTRHITILTLTLTLTAPNSPLLSIPDGGVSFLLAHHVPPFHLTGVGQPECRCAYSISSNAPSLVEGSRAPMLDHGGRALMLHGNRAIGVLLSSLPRDIPR